MAIYLRHRTVWISACRMAALLPLDARLFRRLFPAALIQHAVAVLAIYGKQSRDWSQKNNLRRRPQTSTLDGV